MNYKELDNWRTILWDKISKTILFHNPISKDKRAIFIQDPYKDDKYLFNFIPYTTKNYGKMNLFIN